VIVAGQQAHPKANVIVRNPMRQASTSECFSSLVVFSEVCTRQPKTLVATTQATRITVQHAAHRRRKRTTAINFSSSRAA
jgi:hypothetical protein